MPVSRWSGLSGMPPSSVPPLCPAPTSEPADDEPLEPHPATRPATAIVASIRPGMRISGLLGLAGARVEVGVGHVDERVHCDDEEGAVESQRHHRRKVEMRDGLLGVLADALESEDG